MIPTLWTGFFHEIKAEYRHNRVEKQPYIHTISISNNS
jgi:hypothetical protein